MAKKQTTVKKTTTPEKEKVVKEEKVEEIDTDEKPDVSFLSVWSKKVGKPVEELQKRIEEIVAELKEKHPTGWTDEKYYATARRRLYADFKADLRSSAVPFCIMPLYKKPSNDFGNKAYKEQLKAYDTNPTKAIKEGKVKIEKDAKGRIIKIIPLNTKLKTNKGKENKNLGKPLPEHDYIMTIGGLGIPLSSVEKQDWSTLKPLEMTVSGKYADPSSELYVGSGFTKGNWYLVKVTNQTADDNEESWEVNATSVSKWEEYEGIEINTEDIKSYFDAFYCELGELEEYHNSYAEQSKDGKKSYSNRLVVTEGDVIDIVLSEKEDQSHRMLIDDESLGLADEDDKIVESITCWIDNNEKIEFGKYSHVVVFATSTQSMKKDLATNEYTAEWNAPSLGVMGIIVTNLVEPEIEEKEEPEESIETDNDSAEVEEPDIEEADKEPEKAKKATKKDEEVPEKPEGLDNEEESEEEEEESEEPKADKW